MSAMKNQPGFEHAMEEKRIEDEVRWAVEYEQYLAEQKMADLRERLDIEQGVAGYWRYQAENPASDR